MKLKLYLLTALSSLFLIPALHAQVLIDNGPIYNSVGTGAGGANESVLYTTTFAMGTIGFGHQLSFSNRVADDFIVPGTWQIDSVVFYAYQTGSTTTSTITQVNFIIWNNIPGSVGASIVYGDSTTNRLSSSTFSNTYRITETTVGNTQRPIMRNVCATPGLSLAPGTYWIDWQTDGTLASGPWAVPRVPVGQSVTGNGMQRTNFVWANAVDGGTGTPAQGFPFEIYGAGTPLPIELASFRVEAAGHTHVLDWACVSEINTAYFDIERSANGRDFKSIGRTNAAGTTEATTNYHFVDAQPLQGMNYYRLKQVDRDGKYAFSKVLSIQNSGAAEIRVYPNPAMQELHVSGLSETPQKYSILNHLGQIVLSGTLDARQATIAIVSLQPGSYLLRVGQTDIRFTKQ